MTQDPKNMSVPEFIEIVRAHLNVVAVGLSASNPHVPGNIMMPVLAAAFGKVLSEATACPDISTTLQMRKIVLEAFTDSLRKGTPALQNVHMLPQDRAS